MTKKTYGDGLDASFIISQTKSRQRELQPYTEASPPNTYAETPAPINKEEPRRRRSKGQDYESLFIHNSVSDTRNSNTAYIRRDLHKRLMRIVQVVGDNKVTLYSYLNNILEHHFLMYQEDIETLYKKHHTDIFTND